MKTDLIESTTGSEIGKIAYPSHIRLLWLELLLQEILAVTAFILGMRFLFRRLHSAHFGQIHGFHQAVHSAAVDVNAIFPRKTCSHFLCTQSLVAFDVKRKDFCTERSVFHSSAGILAVAELVVGAPVDLQNPTKCGHSVLMAQRMNSG